MSVIVETQVENGKSDAVEGDASAGISLFPVLTESSLYVIRKE